MAKRKEKTIEGAINLFSKVFDFKRVSPMMGLKVKDKIIWCSDGKLLVYVKIVTDLSGLQTDKDLLLAIPDCGIKTFDKTREFIFVPDQQIDGCPWLISGLGRQWTISEYTSERINQIISSTITLNYFSITNKKAFRENLEQTFWKMKKGGKILGSKDIDMYFGKDYREYLIPFTDYNYDWFYNRIFTVKGALDCYKFSNFDRFGFGIIEEVPEFLVFKGENIIYISTIFGDTKEINKKQRRKKSTKNGEKNEG